MLKRFRKCLVALLVLVTFFAYDTRQASAIIDPISVSVASAALFSLVLAGGGAYYYAKRYARENGGSRDSSGTMVSAAGHIARDATITYVALGAATIQNVTRNVTARVSYDNLKAGVALNPSKYPKLASALSSSGYVDASSYPTGFPSDVGAGSVLKSGTTYYKLGAYTGWYVVDGCSPTSEIPLFISGYANVTYSTNGQLGCTCFESWCWVFGH